jgi:hypothetical protein
MWLILGCKNLEKPLYRRRLRGFIFKADLFAIRIEILHFQHFIFGGEEFSGPNRSAVMTENAEKGGGYRDYGYKSPTAFTVPISG